MADRELHDRLDRAIEAVLAGTWPDVPNAELDPLVRTANALRQMPAKGFQERLGRELKRRAIMTTSAATSIREGFRTVTPYLRTAEGDRLIEFLKRTFGAEELHRSPSAAGFHAEIRIGDSMLMIGSGEPLRGQERIGAFHVYVPDCDAAYARAVEAGAESMGEPTDRPYGERSGFVKDFVGNHWYIATRFPSVAAPEGVGSLLPFLLPSDARALMDFLKRAFDAEEMGVYEEAGRVMHAAVRIGDAVLEMGEPEAEAPKMASLFFLYVPDCDQWHRRAIAAGAVSLAEPEDKPWGARAALARDRFGYEWGTASPLKASSG